MRIENFKQKIIDLLVLFIITAPSFVRLLNNQYFSMHDDQHIVRLFLLDQGLKQGYAYPRWVDGLGFGFGYPLFNFYPPFIYYVSEVFHRLGFTFFWSVKLLVVSGFYAGALGMFVWTKKYIGRLGAYISATLYTFFFYHSVLVYVRGALAEFAALAILPFVFLVFAKLFHKPNITNATFFGIFLAVLVLTQPLVAIPAVFFFCFLFVSYLFQSGNRLKFMASVCFAAFIALSLSAFFWLPSMVERKYTLVDQILTGELALYKLHYIVPIQFLYSLWGYGGSGPGLTDGMTFQLGKIHIGLGVLSLFGGVLYFFKWRKFNLPFNFYLISFFLLLFSLFMTTAYSSFIWERVKYLWYLQFPWRFLTVTNIFISVVGGYSMYFLSRQFSRSTPLQRWSRLLFTALIVLSTIFLYQKYFKPERFIATTDRQRTSFEEIAWRISRTSYEFVPKGVKTKKSELNTTVLALNKPNLQKEPYKLIQGDASVRVIENKFQNKTFLIDAKNQIGFRLNTYNFPGWKAYLNSREIMIDDKNDFRLQVVQIPAGKYKLNFVFEDTPVRRAANVWTFLGFSLVSLIIVLRFKKFQV